MKTAVENVESAGKYILLFSILSFTFICATAAPTDQCPEFVSKAVTLALANWPKISLEDVESSVLQNGFRVQRINDEWYIFSHNNQKISDKNAFYTLLTLFSLGTQEDGDIPNGLDFYLDVSDSNFKSGPVVAFCSYNRSVGITVPDYSLLSWPDSEFVGTFNTLSKELVAVGSSPKLSNNKAIFHGHMVPNCVKRVEGYSKEHVEIVNASMPLTETCKHEYLLHLPDGKSYSSQLKYLLLCNSTVIIVDDFVAESIERGNDMHMLYEEWFYPALIPYVHYFPARNGDEINKAVIYLREHPAEAKQIAHNGALFAQSITHHSCVDKYWQELLSEYRRRMTYEATVPAKNAVSLTNALAEIMQKKQVEGGKANQKHSGSWVAWWNWLTHIQEDETVEDRENDEFL